MQFCSQKDKRYKRKLKKRIKEEQILDQRRKRKQTKEEERNGEKGVQDIAELVPREMFLVSQKNFMQS